MWTERARPYQSSRFVHQRFLTPGVPLKCWAAVLADLVRVTRPGGWVELVEPALTLTRAGGAAERLIELGCRMGRTLGLDTTGIVFRSLDDGLRRAGLIDVERRDLELPIGEWGGQVGSMMASDLRAAFTTLCGVYEARGIITGDGRRKLIGVTMAECEQLRSCIGMAIAFGRKPDSRPPTIGHLE